MSLIKKIKIKFLRILRKDWTNLKTSHRMLNDGLGNNN